MFYLSLHFQDKKSEVKRICFVSFKNSLGVKNLKIKWGVIGAGGIARRRSIPEVMRFSDKSEIVAIMDVSSELVQDVGKEFGIDKCYFTVSDLLREDIDAVYVASPVYAHAEQVTMALNAGKHVLCEKPMALSLSQAEEMVSLAEKKNCKLGVAFMMRYNVYHQKIKQLVAENELGQIVAGRAQLTCWYPPLPGAWRQVKSQGGGGALIDMGCHCIDLLEWIIGPCSEVTAFVDTITHAYEVDDTSTVLMKFENGAQGMVDNYFNVPDAAAKNMLEIYGTQGAVFTHNTIGQDSAGSMWLYSEKGDRGYVSQQVRTGDTYQEIHLEPRSMYAQEFDVFSNWLLNGKKPDISYEAGIRNFKILEAVYQSSKERKAISVR